VAFLTMPFSSYAMTDDLLEIYNDRADLQEAFDSETYQGIEGSAAGFLIDLEDWARQYGWQSYAELSDYAPEVNVPVFVGAYSNTPVPTVTAEHYIVIDSATDTILAASGAEAVWPIASITKLTTVITAMNLGLDVGGKGDVKDVDDVGGAKLYVTDGTTFTVLDLLKSTIVASANNAANAIARLTGYDKAGFVDQMNLFARSLNLRSTEFVDPTGIELGNVSTAREIAYVAREVFKNENIRRLAGTSGISILALNDSDYVRNIASTNWLLYDHAYDDVYVTAGKTGYLIESGWNLVTQMYPMGGSANESVLVVTLGSDSRRDSCDDAHALALWAWENFEWSR